MTRSKKAGALIRRLRKSDLSPRQRLPYYYRREWFFGVAAYQAVYVRFAVRKCSLDRRAWSEVYESCGVRELVCGCMCVRCVLDFGLGHVVPPSSFVDDGL